MSDRAAALAHIFAGLVHLPRRRYDALVVRFAELIPRSQPAIFSRWSTSCAPKFILLAWLLVCGRTSTPHIRLINCAPSGLTDIYVWFGSWFRCAAIASLG